MSINLLDRFKKLPEQLKNMSNKELNETIDSAKHIADEHGQVANRHEDQADKIEAERRQLEEQLRNMGLKQLSPKGLRLQRKIRELKKQEEEKRLLAEGYRDQEFYERTRASEASVLQQKKYSHQEKPEYSKQMQQEHYNYLKYDTTAGRMISAREKMENETDPIKRKELKEIYEARAREHQEYVDGLVYKDGVKPPTTKVAEPATKPGLEKTTEPQKEKSHSKEEVKQGLDKTTQSEKDKEERKEKLLKLNEEIEANRGGGKKLSVFPTTPEPADKEPNEFIVKRDKNGNIIKKEPNKELNYEERKQQITSHLATLPFAEVKECGKQAFDNLITYHVAYKNEPTLENEKEHSKALEDWKIVKECVFDAAERECGQERSRERETDRNPERDPK